MHEPTPTEDVFAAAAALPPSLAAAADDGEPDRALAEALQAWAFANPTDSTAEQAAVVTAFLQARVYVPAVAPEPDRLGMIALRREDGLTAVPVFTGIEALVAWKSDARPLPHVGAAVAAMAIEEGYAVAVIDIDGPITATLPIDTLTEASGA